MWPHRHKYMDCNPLLCCCHQWVLRWHPSQKMYIMFNIKSHTQKDVGCAKVHNSWQDHLRWTYFDRHRHCAEIGPPIFERVTVSTSLGSAKANMYFYYWENSMLPIKEKSTLTSLSLHLELALCATSKCLAYTPDTVSD